MAYQWISIFSAPLLSIGSALVFLLSPAAILASFLGNFAWRFISLPMRILVQFETLYIFCGSAAVIGILAGALFAIGNVAIFSMFGLNLPATIAPHHDSLTASRSSSRRRRRKLDVETNGSLTKHTAANDEGNVDPLNGGVDTKGQQVSPLSSPSSSSGPFLWRSNPPAAAPQHSSVVHSSHQQKQMFPILEEEDEFEDSEGLSASQLRRQHMRLAFKKSSSSAAGKGQAALKKKES